MHTPRAPNSPSYRTRRRWSEEQARQALTALDHSGLGLTAFALGEGLDPQRLSRWRRRLAAGGAPRFDEIPPRVITAALHGEAEPRPTGERFEIVLSCGRIVRVPASFDPSALRRLLTVVEEARAC